MTIYQELRSQCLAAQPPDSHAHGHPLVFRRVFRFACETVPSYEADIRDGMSEQAARQRWAFNIETRYRREFRVDDAPPEGKGPYGFITIAMILGALVMVCIEWLIWKGLDALWAWWKRHHQTGDAVQGLAMQAGQFIDDEDA